MQRKPAFRIAKVESDIFTFDQRRVNAYEIENFPTKEPIASGHLSCHRSDLGRQRELAVDICNIAIGHGHSTNGVSCVRG